MKKSQTSNPSPKKVIDKQKTEIDDLESQANKAIENIQTNIEKTFKFVCALRLDMIADLLETLNPKWSKQLDEVASRVEKGEWVNTQNKLSEDRVIVDRVRNRLKMNSK